MLNISQELFREVTGPRHGHTVLIFLSIIGVLLTIIQFTTTNLIFQNKRSRPLPTMNFSAHIPNKSTAALPPK
jgi:hypothetical protein